MEHKHGLDGTVGVIGKPLFDEMAPKIRVRGRKISNWWVNLETLRSGIGDSLFGFRVYPAAQLLKIMNSHRWMRRFDFDAEAVVRLGYYKALHKSKSVFKKSTGKQGAVELKALENALSRMKRETAKSIVFHLKDYRENLKFSYFFKLVELVAENFAQQMADGAAAGATEVMGLPPDSRKREPSSVGATSSSGSPSNDALASLVDTGNLTRPAARPGARGTQTTLAVDTSLLYRGDKLTLSGRVADAGGEVARDGLADVVGDSGAELGEQAAAL